MNSSDAAAAMRSRWKLISPSISAATRRQLEGVGGVEQLPFLLEVLVVGERQAVQRRTRRQAAGQAALGP